MLEKPDFPDEKIIACLNDEYGLRVARIVFLPIGADRNTAVYRAVAGDGTPYFVKLRGGAFGETSVALPKFLSDQGIAQIIAPLATNTGRLWADLDERKVILYPFVEGRDGYQVDLSARHWRELGSALNRIHATVLPPALQARIRQETYAAHWRETVRTFLVRVEHDVFDEPVAVKLAAFLRTKRDEIEDLVARAERLAQALQVRSPEFVLCHSDLHAGNVLIDNGGALYIVDWDDPILAPKERDLMYPGGAQGFGGHTPQEEEDLFYRGYGPVRVDASALAYYRYERIVEDMAVYCQQLLLTEEGGQDREQSFEYLASNFLPNNTVEIAYKSDKAL